MKDDRRANRTRIALRDALIELIKEKHYDEITVQNVIDRANVGRSTFYSHYRDKEDLLRTDWEKLLLNLVTHIRWNTVSDGGRFIPIKELLSHVQDFRVFCMALARSRKLDLLFKTGTTYLEKKIEAAIASQLKDQAQLSIPLPVLANYLASAIFSQLKWWFENNMTVPPEEVDEMFHQLVMPGFRAAFQNAEWLTN